MRIALVSQEYPPQTAHGGIATQTRAKAAGLAALGHEVHVVTHAVDGRRSRGIEDGVTVVRVPGFDGTMPLHTDIARWVAYSALVAAEVARIDGVEVVDFPDWGNESLVHLLNRAPWASVPTVIHLHGPLTMLADRLGWPDTRSDWVRVGADVEGHCLRMADAIVASSRYAADWVAQRHGLDADRIPVIHVGVDTARFRPGAAAPDERPTIVCAGRVVRSKGADTVVDAACAVAASWPSLRLRLAGACPDAALVAELRARATAAGFPQLLEFAGAVAHDDLPAELCRGDVVALPSRFESGPGFVGIEAMACALPVVVCSGSGADELLVDGVSGRAVPPGNAAALAAAIHALLADAPMRRRIGAEARASVLRDAERGRCIARYERFLRDVVERAR